MASTPQGVVMAGASKRSYVRNMFTAIAPRYDLLNHLLSLNIDRSWRREAVGELAWRRRPDGRYLDLCAGTLDLAAELASKEGFGGEVVGADFVIPMLRLGKGKAQRVTAVGADALQMPFPDGSFDGAMVAFGVRNLSDLEQGLGEVARLVRSGGRFVVLEFGTPSRWPIRFLYRLYFRGVLPLVGRLVSRHGNAYTYLPESVESFPSSSEFMDLMARSGFRGVRHRSLTFGIAYLYWGDRR